MHFTRQHHQMSTRVAPRASLAPRAPRVRRLARVRAAPRDGADELARFVRAFDGDGMAGDEELDAFLSRACVGASARDVIAIAADAFMLSEVPPSTSKKAAAAAAAAVTGAERARRGRAASAMNAAASAFARMGKPRECEDLMRGFARYGVTPDVVTWSIVIAAKRRNGDDIGLIVEEALADVRRGSRAGRKKKKVYIHEDVRASVGVLMDDADDGIGALNKPAGMLTHASEGAGKSATLVDVAMDIFSGRLSELNGVDKRGVVSRLDKPTSGIVILAKTDAAHAELCTQYYQRDVRKTYVALVEGVLASEDGEIHTPLENRPATSAWKRIETFQSTSGASFSLVQVQPKSGRYHQIRQHMASIGHPLVGDVVYRRKTSSPAKSSPKCVVEALSQGKPGTIFFLHCARVSLVFNGRERVIEAPLPVAFETLLARIRSEMK